MAGDDGTGGAAGPVSPTTAGKYTLLPTAGTRRRVVIGSSPRSLVVPSPKAAEAAGSGRLSTPASPARRGGDRGFYSDVHSPMAAVASGKDAAATPNSALKRASPTPGKLRRPLAATFRAPPRPVGMAEISSGHAAPAEAPSIGVLRPRTFSNSANADVSTAPVFEYLNASVSARALEPKVMVPYKQTSGKAPRPIEIERKRRLFAAQSIEVLLRERGIDYSLPPDQSSASNFPYYLPVEAFDNTDFDARDPADWIALGEASGIPVRALHRPSGPQGVGTWVLGLATSYDQDQRVFSVSLDLPDHPVIKVPRVHMLILAEDPFVFADRVASAHAARNNAEAMLRYNLYIDSMPADDVSTLSEDRVQRIVRKTIVGKEQRDTAASLGADVLMSEVVVDYARAMNKIVFDLNLHDPTQRDLFASLELPQDNTAVDVPWSGVVELPEHNYAENSRQFAFHSFLTKKQVINAMSKVRFECNRIQDACFFNVGLTKSLRLEEFEQTQTQTYTMQASFLKEGWLTALRNGIHQSLKEVGKGWFNLQERNKEVYEISKLKKFMVMVRFMMQDSTRFLAEESLRRYSQLICTAAAADVDVRGPGDVVTTAPDAPSIDAGASGVAHLPRAAVLAATKRPPLFMIDVVLRDQDTRFDFSTDLATFQTLPITLLDRMVDSLQNIPQVEPMVMEGMFWSNSLVLETLNKHEPEVKATRACLNAALARALAPVRSYLATYDRYLDLARLDCDAYLAEFEAANHDMDRFKEEYTLHRTEGARIEAELPQSIRVGMFLINCDRVRKWLSEKRARLATAILDLLAKRARTASDELCNEFSAIFSKLNERPQTIEDLVALQEYMATVSSMILRLDPMRQDMMHIYDVVEEFQYNLSVGDFAQRWVAYGWPSKLLDKVDSSQRSMEMDRNRMEKEMLSSQDAFAVELEELSRVVSGFTKHSDLDKVKEVAAEVRKILQQLHRCEEKAKTFNSRESLFGFPQTEYAQLAKIIKDFEPFAQLWTTSADWVQWHRSWTSDPFVHLDAERMEADLSNAWRTMFKCVKSFKEVPGCYKIAKTIKEQMDEFKPNVPLVAALRNPGMRDRHWEALEEKLGFAVKPDDAITLTQLLEMNLNDSVEDITGVCDVAGKEYTIENALNKMEAEWQDVKFEVSPYRESGTYIMKGSDDISQMLDDHTVLIAGMSFSAFKKPFEERISKWEQRLHYMTECLEEWLACQRQWLYLEPIFSSEDINKQMPTEGKRFATLDRIWRKIMEESYANPSVLAVCSNEKLLDNFQECNKLLDLVQKGLTDYLETKRSAFPRFYFLSNDELLEILSQTKDPTAVQPHLRKCFDNIACIDFDENGAIVAMNSAESEKVPFLNKFYPSGNVETWLLELQRTMQVTLRHVMKSALKAYPATPRTEWVQNWPGQIVLAGCQVFWTKQVRTVLREAGLAGLKNLYQVLLKQLGDLTELVRGDLKPLARLTLGALIVMEVHARDVVARLIEDKVEHENDFEWISQLRYYWENDDLVVKMVNSQFIYGYEYLGNTDRLVITPLTDRCYMTLTAALRLNLGGAPQGPAGTGKTETTKDLAKALAKQCVVFNCSDGLDYLTMGKLFKGLASAGAWACFDEFNRIDLEVLSVVAQQIMTIQKAVQAHVKRFLFDGVEIALDPTCAVFITMNPGYAGRSELPDNLKALFRPMAMMVPDYAMIAEIKLFSYGFTKAGPLARKMVATFRLSSEQLSSQDHYDFGMRAVKTVISTAGNLKRQYPAEAEDLLLLRALCDCNVPKFLAEDIPLFNGIISDLFPGIEPMKSDYNDLKSQLQQTCQDMHLQATDEFLNKCVQLYETTVVRHGLMLVGPTGSGKTTCYRVLARTLTALADRGVNPAAFAQVKYDVVNPKSITMGQLYGEFDKTTHEWTDGVLANLIRVHASDTTPLRKWLVFDGPVDAIWIENMNTVLDDNKKLCLNSGELIALSRTQTMMFEVEDLAVASPATVSRCGMVYMEPSALGLDPFLTTWCERLQPAVKPHAARLRSLLDTYLPASLAFLRENCKEPVSTTNGSLCFSLLSLLDCFLAPYAASKRNGEPRVIDDQALTMLELAIEPQFFFSLVWSVGATTDNPGRVAFDKWLRSTMQDKGATTAFPADGLVFNYAFDTEKREWVHWMNTIPEYELSSSTPFHEIIVPTIDTVRYNYLMKLLLSNGKHVLATGPTGTGKSLTVTNYLMTGLESYQQSFTTVFSAQTSANQTQDVLDSKFDKRRKGVYGPPLGKEFVLFIDDVNMPAKEEYGAQPPIELLRQWMDHHGWYDRKTLTFKEIVDIVLVGAMGPPGGGRNPLTARFKRHFNLISFTDISNDSLTRIFSTILSKFLERFDRPITELSGSMVNATINVYETISSELLPTPEKTHYTFNMRDVSKVFQGLLSGEPSKIREPSQMLRLWVHECQRVFQDRLINDQDRDWFQKLMARSLDKYYKTSWEDTIPETGVIFGDFLIPGADPKVYQEITDTSHLVKIVEEYLDEYNAVSNTPMSLVMFLDAIKHLSRISRVIRQPMGNALLLGVGGSGRQSLTRLAAYMAEYDLFQIEITRSYGPTEWREDLKQVLMKAGCEGKQVAFLFTDTQIVDESFLEDISSILNSGEVPNIWTLDEQENILSQVRPLAQAQGATLTKAGIMNVFNQRVRRNIHVVLCMSPIGDTFRDRLRQFPSLVNCCTIDWFSDWPDQALRSVASESLAEVKLGTDETRQAAIDMCVFVHMTVHRKGREFLSELGRYNYVTPTSYLELLGMFRQLLDEKRNDLALMVKRLETGLDKLLDTAKDVEAMQEELKALQPVLLLTSKEVDEMMVQIAKDKVMADETRAVVIREEADAAKKAEETKAIADDAQRDLDEALPALEEAVASLKTLNRQDVVEVRSMKRPPAGVKLVMEAVCIMKSVKPQRVDGAKMGQKVDDFWGPSQNLLADSKFLESLAKFDKDNIDEKIIQKIQPYIENPDFHPSVVAKVSKACMSLCMWVRAMEKYYWISKGVAPKRARLKQAQDSLEVTLKGLNDAKRRLKDVENKIAELERTYDESVAKKEELARKVEDCKTKLERAHKLISGLSDEKERWEVTIQELRKSQDNVIGDVIVSAGLIAYGGAFTKPFRESLVTEWQNQLNELGLPYTNGCSVRTTLADPVKLRQWTIYGLPRDTMSIENALMISKARRWPLMMDPQGQANKWVKNMEREAGIDVVKMNDSQFLRTLENAVRFGKPVLIENVSEEIDPVLEPVLLKQTFKQQGSEVIRIGDSVIPYHPDFRLYMTTRMRNPHYRPEISTKVSLLNFTLSTEGLEDQLLGLVVAKERPDLEEAKNQLVVSNARMKKELKEIEDKILFLLSNSQGNILDDELLIETLGASKKTSADIKTKVAEAEKTEVEIDVTRSKYEPVAKRAAVLFFCITDLANIDPMYQYSLSWFLNLFAMGIENSPKSDVLEERLEHLNDYFTFSLYTNVCRSLFEKHKLLFSFLLCVRILQASDMISGDEWRFLFAGGAVLDSGDVPSNPAPDWLTDKAWGEILYLSRLNTFAGLDEDFVEYVDFFKRIFDSSHPHREELPGRWGSGLDMFQKLLLLRCLRPDKMTSAVQDFIVFHHDQRFIEPPTFDLSSSYRDSSPTSPLIFVLSSGADPASELYKFAEEMRFSKKLNAVSLGQGQGPRAERLINDAMERGTWVLLQNCHLAVSWLPKLENIVENISPDKVHRDFRLWLTSMPSPKFPVTILQDSVKMTNEPPKGIRANLMRSYHNFDQAFLGETTKPGIWRKLLFSLCFFHAVIQERRKFGPLGWNIPYEYTSGDLEICIRQLQMFLDEYQDEVPYKVLTFLAGHINYGGRVTDELDRRTLMTILQDYYRPEVLIDNHAFSPSGNYVNPAVEMHAEYMEHIRSLPMMDSPEVFGLHENADITFAQNETTSMFAALLSLQPRQSSSGGKSREEVIGETAVDMLSRVPEPLNIDEVMAKHPITYSESMSTVLIQEVLRYNKLLTVVRSSLQALLKALKGLVVMSGELETLGNSLYNNQVPEMWAAKAYPSLKPLSSWTVDLIARIAFITNWVQNGTPKVFWISGFFFPQAFLTGTLQNFARKYTVPIDTISFDYKVIRESEEEIPERPADGCYIRGLFMEGARFDRDEMTLVDSRPKELFSEMPIIWLLPKANRVDPDPGTVYKCPVYKVLSRAGTLSTTGHSTNFVLTVELPTTKDPRTWTLRGVALSCSLNY